MSSAFRRLADSERNDSAHCNGLDRFDSAAAMKAERDAATGWYLLGGDGAQRVLTGDAPGATIGDGADR